MSCGFAHHCSALGHAHGDDGVRGCHGLGAVGARPSVLWRRWPDGQTTGRAGGAVGLEAVGVGARAGSLGSMWSRFVPVLLAVVACGEEPVVGRRDAGPLRPATGEEPRREVDADLVRDETQEPAGNLEVAVRIGVSDWTATCQGRTRSNELRVPIGRPVKILFESEAAVVFEMGSAGLRTAVPRGQAKSIWFEGTKVGRWPVRIGRVGEVQEVGSIFIVTKDEFERGH